MKLRNLSVLVAVFLVMAGCQKPSGRIPSFHFSPLEFKPPKTERVVLSNGMVLHMLENHELPIIQISSLVKIGDEWDSPAKRGLADLTGAVWRAGGTTNVPPDELDARLDFIGAGIGTSIERKNGEISLSVLTKDLDEGLTLFADLIKNPAFDEKRFEVAKNNMLESIRRENDSPGSIVSREFRRLLFKGYIHGLPATIESVSRITREDCAKFYGEHVGPESFLIGISGDFDSDEMKARFEKLFAGFKPAAKKFPPLPKPPDTLEPGIYLVEKKLPQTAIRAGHFGISRKNPDYYAARVMNNILGGGGFSSRLLREIRSEKGLAYSVWSYFVGGYDDNGAFLLGGETKAETTYDFIASSKAIMEDIITRGVSKEELDLAKTSIVNAFVHGFEKDSKIVSRYLWLEYFDMPKDYLEKFREKIDAVTLSQVKNAAARYLHPDRMIVLAVGDRERMGGKMSKLGRLKEVKIDR